MQGQLPNQLKYETSYYTLLIINLVLVAEIRRYDFNIGFIKFMNYDREEHSKKWHEEIK